MWTKNQTILAFLLACTCFSFQRTIHAEKKKGFRFPSFETNFIQYQPKRKYSQKKFHFSTLVGKKPVLMFYFLPQHPPSLTELQAFAATSKIFKDKIAFLAVTKAQTKKEAKEAYKKIKSVNVQIPILLDEKGLIAYVMLTKRVPSYALINSKGFLQLAGAGNLTEKVAPGMTLMQALHQTLEGKPFAFVKAPGYSPNPYDLIGSNAPQLKANSFATKTPLSLQSKGTKRKKPMLLVFWSIQCPHCRKTMPFLEKYAHQSKDRLDISTVVSIDDKKAKDMLSDYVKKQQLKSLKIFTQEDPKTIERYKVMTVPTFFLIDPKGIIQSVHIGGGKKIGDSVDSMLRQTKQAS